MPNPDHSLMLSILTEIRPELRNHGILLLQLADGLRRHDRSFSDMDRRFSDLEHRIGDKTGELELMVKSEPMGWLTHFETQIDEKWTRPLDRLDALEGAK